eukprot:6474448-Amphidinium_carterae.2
MGTTRRRVQKSRPRAPSTAVSSMCMLGIVNTVVPEVVVDNESGSAPVTSPSEVATGGFARVRLSNGMKGNQAKKMRLILPTF